MYDKDLNQSLIPGSTSSPVGVEKGGTEESRRGRTPTMRLDKCESNVYTQSFGPKVVISLFGRVP